MKNSDITPYKQIQIWELFKEGDRQAFADLFELSSDLLFRYGTKFIEDDDLVKDCIQELFIKLYNNRQNLPALEKPLFYLFKSLKNLLINAIQEKEKIVKLSPEEIPFHVKLVFDNEEEMDIQEEVRSRFEYVLNLLSDRQKEAIYLKYHAGLSYEEISEVLEINYQSARNLVHRSIDKIKARMDLKLFILLLSHCM